MASHGGMREGSGRPAGAVNKATSELKLNLSELAREYTNDALDTLVDVMQSACGLYGFSLRLAFIASR